MSQVKEESPNLAYLHAIEPCAAGADDHEYDHSDSNEFLRKIWGDKVFISVDGHTPQTAAETASTLGGLVAFGHHYISTMS